jgi:hypothetical protein
MAEGYDNTFRRGDAITLLLTHRPYINLGIPPSANDYNDASCVTVAIYGPDKKEIMVETVDMKRVPNRPGWYYYRYQTTREMSIGVYTVIFTAVTLIDGTEYSTRNVQEFILQDDGIV